MRTRFELREWERLDDFFGFYFKQRKVTVTNRQRSAESILERRSQILHQEEVRKG